jgi:hypothetical protein
MLQIGKAKDLSAPICTGFKKLSKQILFIEMTTAHDSRIIGVKFSYERN